MTYQCCQMTVNISVTLQCNCATEFVYDQGQMDQFVSLQLHVRRLHTEKALVQSLYVTEQYLVL